MSNKPPKRGDRIANQNDLRAKVARKERRTGVTPELPPYTVIFCEGTKTEPHYLQEMVNCITERYKDYAVKNRIKIAERIKIMGVARSGKALLEYAKEHLPYSVAEVWLVYDKDDFPAGQFNDTPKMAEAESKKGKAEWHTAWSNECIELWFLLHYQDLQANVSRARYRAMLKKHYPTYTKNSIGVYATLKPLTSKAINRAKMLHKPNMTPSDLAPYTTMYKLVEFLRKYTE